MRFAGAAGRRRPKLVVTSSIAIVVLVGAAVLAARIQRPDLDVSGDERTVIDRLESVLMHDSETPQYARVVNEFDGRGYVAGIGDFSTAGGEALEVIHVYTARRGANELSRTFGAVLGTLGAENNDDVSALDGFPQAWQLASVDPTFRQAQVDVLQERYFTPALDQARELGLNTPLGLAVIYDSLVQHGTGGPDGLLTLLRQTDERAGGAVAKVGERDWLRAFLEVRRDNLADPADPAHQEVWPYEVGRVDALSALLEDRHDQLVPPLTVAPYGTPKVIDLSPFDAAPSLYTPSLPGAAPAPGRSGSPSRSGEATNSSSARPSGAAGATRGTPTPKPPAPKTTTDRGNPSTVTGPAAGIVVRIVSRATGNSIGVANASTRDGAPIVSFSNASSPAQQWRITTSVRGCFGLVNSASGRALDNPDGSADDGAPMQQWYVFAGNENQTWCFQHVGGGWYSIRNLTSGSLLDLQDSGRDDGTPIQQWSGDPGLPNINQTWQLVRVG